VAVALVSTVVVFGAIVAAVVNSAGWPEVEQAFFNGSIFTDSFGEITRAFLSNGRIFCIA